MTNEYFLVASFLFVDETEFQTFFQMDQGLRIDKNLVFRLNVVFFSG